MTDTPYTAEPEPSAVDLDTALIRLTLEQWLRLQGNLARRDEPHMTMEGWDNDFMSELSDFARSQGVSDEVVELLVDHENELRRLVGAGWCAHYITTVAKGDPDDPALANTGAGELARLSSYRHPAEPVVGLHPKETLETRRRMAHSIAASQKYVRRSTETAIQDARFSAKIMGSMPITEEAIALTIMLELYALTSHGRDAQPQSSKNTWSEQIGFNFRATVDYLTQREEISEDLVATISEREERICALAQYAEGVLSQVRLVEAIRNRSELDNFLHLQRRNAQTLLAAHRGGSTHGEEREVAMLIRRDLFTAT